MISFDAENDLSSRGLCAVGIDEAGRGALAGPVVAAAVILDPQRIPSGVDDSKRLRASERSVLAEHIRSTAMAWGIGACSAEHIDAVNILQATFDAMHAAIDQCLANLQDPAKNVHLLVDGNRFRPHRIPHTAVVAGDASVLSIAAASILAKTHRDAIMQQDVAQRYPEYEFERHKGYGTALHRQALLRLGPCAEHRRSFLSKIFPAAAHDDRQKP